MPSAVGRASKLFRPAICRKTAASALVPAEPLYMLNPAPFLSGFLPDAFLKPRDSSPPFRPCLSVNSYIFHARPSIERSSIRSASPICSSFPFDLDKQAARQFVNVLPHRLYAMSRGLLIYEAAFHRAVESPARATASSTPPFHLAGFMSPRTKRLVGGIARPSPAQSVDAAFGIKILPVSSYFLELFCAQVAFDSPVVAAGSPLLSRQSIFLPRFRSHSNCPFTADAPSAALPDTARLPSLTFPYNPRGTHTTHTVPTRSNEARSPERGFWPIRTAS